MAYPEHEKLKAVKDQSQAIGEFLDWLESQGIHRMRWVSRDHPMTGRIVEGWVSDNRSVQTLLAEFFSIDQDRLEAEKRHMLELIRAQYDGETN